MSSLEDSLRQTVARDPGDWNARSELAAHLSARRAVTEFDLLLLEAPSPPESETDLHFLIQLANEIGCWNGLGRVISLYLAWHPGSAWAHLVQAQTLQLCGEMSAAAWHYERARVLDPAIHDEHLALLSAQTDPGAIDSTRGTEIPPKFPRVPGIPTSTSKVAVKAPSHPHLALDFVHPTKVKGQRSEKTLSVGVAIFVHAVILILMGLYVVSQVTPHPPQIAASLLPSESPGIESDVLKRPNPTVTNPAAPMQEMITTMAVSSVSLPALETGAMAFDFLGMGGDFGPSMSFGTGDSGGMVGFFGMKAKSDRVVFAVDFSQSMKGGKAELMRRELSKSILALPSGTRYQVIMFAGPAWVAGETVSKMQPLKDGFLGYKIEGEGKSELWYLGWSPDERLKDGKKRGPHCHFSGGMAPRDLPTPGYLTAKPSTVGETVGQIQNAPLLYGTDWRWPLMMAANMRPDTIYFMTDGVFKTPNEITASKIIDELLEHNKSQGNPRIHTICLMELKARTELERLAKGSEGNFTLVLEDGTSLRGADLDKMR